MQSNNLIKKIKRKQRKHKHMLVKETGVKCCDIPTRYIGICNSGQVNGLTEEVLLGNYQKFGVIERILLVPGKSCSFVCFKNMESAKEAFDSTNGALKIAQDLNPVYLSYVEDLPELETQKVYDRLPQGLTIIENFISEDEEMLLLSLCKFEASSGMKHRQVKHFGYEFRYDNNNIDKDKPLKEQIPSECDFLFKRLSFDFTPDQLTANYYKPGQGIPPHVDTHSAFLDPILSLSLGSSVVMEFKKEQTYCVLLPGRSLAVISGESRYAWTHGIPPKKYDFYFKNNECVSLPRGDRISFTFRKIRKDACDCSYPEMCDSKKEIQSLLAQKLENQHVHEVYEEIADHFSETRHKPWPNVVQFIENLDIGAVLIDVGCGNGKYFDLKTGIIEIGTDRSVKLASLCRDKNLEIFTCNCLNLPLKDESADAVISIAVIHHLSTEERRIQALSEMIRVLRPSGQLLIYVWAKEQIKNQEKSSYIKQDRKNRKTGPLATTIEENKIILDGISLPVHTNRTDFTHKDVLVPWKKKGENQNFLRFYHVFQEGELQELCEKLSNVEITNSYYDQGNWCVVIKKIK